MVLEPRSILYAVRSAESLSARALLDRSFLTLLCWYKGRSTIFTSLSFMRRIFASGFQAGFLYPSGWILSEVKYVEKKESFL